MFDDERNPRHVTKATVDDSKELFICIVINGVFKTQ